MLEEQQDYKFHFSIICTSTLRSKNDGMPSTVKFSSSEQQWNYMTLQITTLKSLDMLPVYRTVFSPLLLGMFRRDYANQRRDMTRVAERCRKIIKSLCFCLWITLHLHYPTPADVTSLD